MSSNRRRSFRKVCTQRTRLCDRFTVSLATTAVIWRRGSWVLFSVCQCHLILVAVFCCRRRVVDQGDPTDGCCSSNQVEIIPLKTAIAYAACYRRQEGSRNCQLRSADEKQQHFIVLLVWLRIVSFASVINVCEREREREREGGREREAMTQRTCPIVLNFIDFRERVLFICLTASFTDVCHWRICSDAKSHQQHSERLFSPSAFLNWQFFDLSLFSIAVYAMQVNGMTRSRNGHQYQQHCYDNRWQRLAHPPFLEL